MALTEQQKQKKAQQKKQKRKTGSTLQQTDKQVTDKIAGYLDAPFYECLIPNNLFVSGIGNVLITRLSAKGEVVVCSFIVDVFCLGVKKALFKTMPLPEYENVFKPGILASHDGYAFTKIKPACAKKLLEGAVQYAKDLGFSPSKDYHSLKTIFGTEKLGWCWARYRYGQDKMPFYVKGPNESAADAQKIIAKLEQSCGAGNFQFHL